MSQIESFLQQEVWRFWDQSLSGKSRSALESFAADDLLCHLVGQSLSPATVRTWVHDQTVVLGIQDHRLPFVEDAQDFLTDARIYTNRTKFRRFGGCIG